MLTLGFRFVQIILFIYLFYEFEVTRFSNYKKDGLFLGTNIRSQTIYMIWIGNLLQIVYSTLVYFKRDTDRKIQMYFVQLVVSTSISVTSAYVLLSNNFGKPGSDCTYTDNVTLPIYMVEGVCIAPANASIDYRLEYAFSFSAVQKLDTKYKNKLLLLRDSCLAENMWIIGQTLLLAMALYQAELLYLNSEMRLDVQLHHFVIIALTLVPFYTDFSTVSIDIVNIQTFFTAFEHPLYIALLCDKLLTDEEHILTKRNLYWFAYWFGIVTKTIAHISSLYMLFRYEMYVDTVAFYVWLVILHVYLYLLLNPLRALQYLIDKKTRKLVELSHKH